ncbi:hypothetical protein B484DRAFT_425297 [Ochromonadaceae sp. CCMP2298]|nr:hypothetical protein B484DRAFT_425297 [Ochromonadaceae sp. CCMP2298]
MWEQAVREYLAGLQPRVTTAPGAARELVPEDEIHGPPPLARLFQIAAPAPFDSEPFRNAYMAALGWQNYMGADAEPAWPFSTRRPVLKPAQELRRTGGRS